jgi:site-specific DNA-cytosine methylase
MKPLEDYLEDLSTHTDNITNKNITKIVERHSLDLTKNYVISCAGFGNAMLDKTPTITKEGRYYLTKYNRYLTPREKLNLMGFPSDFKQVVSDNQLGKQAGNSIQVDCLCAIVASLLKNHN